MTDSSVAPQGPSSSTEEPPASAGPSAGDPSSTASADGGDLHRLEGRLARLEAQVRAHAERLQEVAYSERRRQRRGLWLRLIILVLALGGFFWLRSGAAG